MDILSADTMDLALGGLDASDIQALGDDLDSYLFFLSDNQQPLPDQPSAPFSSGAMVFGSGSEKGGSTAATAMETATTGAGKGAASLPYAPYASSLPPPAVIPKMEGVYAPTLDSGYMGAFGALPPAPPLYKPVSGVSAVPRTDSDAVSVVSSDISESSRLSSPPYSWDLPSPYGNGLRMGGDARSETGSMPPSAKRKDRNAREQARSLKITQQISKLKKVLETDGRGSKASKMGVLMGVEKYISDLESDVANLNLTCQQARGRKAQAPTSHGDAGNDPEQSGKGKEHQVVSGVDYHTLFLHVSTPMAVAGLDGRVLEANSRFELTSGYTRDELQRLTFFNLLAPEVLQDTFAFVAAMITPVVSSSKAESKFTRLAVPNRQQGGGRPGKMFLTVSLVRAPDGTPKFFLCSLD